MMNIEEHEAPSRSPDHAVLREQEDRTGPGGLVVVGVGTAAGGRSAIEAFLKHLPKTPGIAFFVVPMSPEHERLLASMQHPHTAVPVARVNGASQDEPRHIYALPPASGASAMVARGPSGPAEVEAFIRQLQRELDRVRAHLRTTTKEHEAATEVLTVSNKEMASVNETLTSAAEELETSREELLSVNEALIALNEELERKLEEINGINGDLQNLMNATEIGTIFLDGQLCIKRFTSPVEDLFYIARADIGRPLAHLAHRLNSDALVADAARVLREHVMVEREMQLTANRQWFLVRLRPYHTVDGAVEGVVIAFVDITAQKRYDEHLETLNETLEAMVAARVEQVRQLAAELIMAEHAERQRIAQVLHDDLQQVLFALQMKVERLGRTLSEEQVDRLSQVNTLIARAIDVTRALTVELSPTVLKGEDFTTTLDWLAIRMEDMHGLKVVVEAESPVFLPLDLRALLYQLVRELLFNVVKHAGVDRARVKLDREEGRLILLVEDEGTGFDPAARPERDAAAQGGFGLHSVRQRLSLLGGRLETNAAPGQGTRMTLFIPLGKDTSGVQGTRPNDREEIQEAAP